VFGLICQCVLEAGGNGVVLFCVNANRQSRPNMKDDVYTRLGSADVMCSIGKYYKREIEVCGDRATNATSARRTVCGSDKLYGTMYTRLIHHHRKESEEGSSSS
jgi:hypothetical protein